MNLGKLISKLESIENKNKLVKFEDGSYPDGFSSYRGDYSNLGVEFSKIDNSYLLKPIQVLEKESVTVERFLNRIKNNVLNEYFQGWKGGEFYMHEEVLIHKAQDGCLGPQIINVLEKENEVILEVNIDSI